MLDIRAPKVESRAGGVWNDADIWSADDDLFTPPETQAREIEVALRRAGFISDVKRERLKAIAASRWFFVRNTHPKLQLPCPKCGAGRITGGVMQRKPHPYFTSYCTPRPFNGLQQFWEVVEQVDPDGRLRRHFDAGTVLEAMEPITYGDALWAAERIYRRTGRKVVKGLL